MKYNPPSPPAAEADEAIRAVCEPGFDLPHLQRIVVEMLRDDRPVAKLEALRIAIPCYDPMTDAESVAHAFDTHSQLSYDLSDSLRRQRRAFAGIAPDEISTGLIGITMIGVDHSARGSRASHRLIEHLRRLHCGMGWHVALEAVPMEFKEGPDGPFRAMRRRLVEHYTQAGLQSLSPRGAPSLMGAFWDGESL